jgi:sugar phosphate isomerase/epimerase
VVRVGIDSYSYHRLLGELRPGEQPVRERLADGGRAVAVEARSLAVDGVSLETCFLPGPDRQLLASLADAAGPLELALSWGAPNGLELGSSEPALADLLDWIEGAAAIGVRTMRIVVAGPSLREAVDDDAIARTAAVVVRACEAASARGIVLAVENHGDLSAAQLAQLLHAVDDPSLGVCFDTANALRVGDDALEAASLLAPAIRMLHLKDVEPVVAATDIVAGPCSVRYGTGVVPLDGVLDVVQTAGFDGLVCVEIAQLAEGDDERELVEDGVRWLRTRGRAA